MTQRRRDRDLQTRTQQAMIGHAIFRPESALTIALIIMLIFFYPAPFHWWK